MELLTHLLPTSYECEACGQETSRRHDLEDTEDTAIFECFDCEYIIEFIGQDGKVFGCELWI